MGAPFVWFDLTTTTGGDKDGVRDFYTQLFGWTIGPGLGDYQGWMTDAEQPWAGILPATADTAGRWIPYVVVDDVDVAAKQATDLGGSVIRDKATGPAGTSVLVTDPGGAVVALFTPPPDDRLAAGRATADRQSRLTGSPAWPAADPDSTQGEHMTMTGEDLFWELVEPMYADPGVQRSTMMGLPCVRRDGRFFASYDRRTGALLVKLPRDRVDGLVKDAAGEPFAPAGRVFREWVAVPDSGRGRWQRLLTEAHDHAGAVASEPADAGRFAGFSNAARDFLAGLAHDNTKEYFDAHRNIYRQELLEPSKVFVVELGAALQRRISPHLRAEPRIGGSLFRIANDLRFAPGKPPYKPHLDVAFWQGGTGPRRDPALILRIAAAEIHLGAGVPALTGAARERYRAALHDTALVKELDTEVTALTDADADLSDPTRVRPPAGFATADPAYRFAVRDGFYVTQRLPSPAVVTTPGFIPWCTERLTAYAPIHRWLARHATAMT